MAEEQQNSGYSSGGNIIPTPEEAATFQPQVVAEGDSFLIQLVMTEINHVICELHPIFIGAISVFYAKLKLKIDYIFLFFCTK